AASLLFAFGDPFSPILAWFGAQGSPEKVAIVGLVVGGAYVAIALLARTAYPRAIVERIRTRTFDTSDAAMDIPIEGSESSELLQEQLASEDAEIVRFAAEYLYGADRRQAIDLVLKRLHESHDALRAELLDLIA